MTFAEPEGHPVSLDTCGHYLVVATDVGIVRVYDLSRREAKAHTNPKNLADIVPGFGTIVSAKVSCNGSRVSILVKTVSVVVFICFLIFLFCSVKKRHMSEWFSFDSLNRILRNHVYVCMPFNGDLMFVF